MIPLIEVKYIAIKWHDENSVLKVEEEIIHTTSLEIENEKNYKLELQAYKRILNGKDGQVAFHISNLGDDVEPYFIDSMNNQVPLLKITDPTNHKEWWVEKGNWNGNYRNAPLWNHVGDAKIVFGNIICNITIRANSFTREQLELYLNDFRNDFWYLILKEDSITQGEARGQEIRLLNKNSIDLIDRFIEFVEKVLDNPKKELREIQGVKDIKKVKPVPKTFMEIATTGFKKKLISRDTIESFNVAENKFIYYILDKVYKIVFYMFRASGHMDEIFERKLQSDKKRINNFTNTKKIDKETFENEIEDLKNKVKKEKENLINCISKQDHTARERLELEIKNQRNIFEQITYAIQTQPQINNQTQPQRFIIRLESRQQDYGNKIQFWGKIKTPESNEWDRFEPKHSLSLEFDKNFNFLNTNEEYEIFAQKFYNKQPKRDGGIIHKEFFTNIIELKSLNLQQQNIEKELIYQTIYIKLSYKQNDHHDKIQYWGKVKKNYLDNWLELNQQDSLSLEFDKDLFEDVLYEFHEYKITGYVRKSIFEKQNGGKIHKRYFQYIEDIEQLTKSSSQQALDGLEIQRQSLESTNWIRPLSNREKEEQRKEKEALEKATNILKENQQNNLELIDNLKPTINRLKKLLNKCKELNIQKDSYFPNSMTFIQNPNYQGSYSFYKKINEIVGVDENLFVQLQLLEKIGLLDIPTIYEKWCYLQIIKVLIDKYRFQPEDNWKIKLANQIMNNLDNIKNVKIQFTNKSIEREVDLWLEKVLDSGKRPDFMLDIKSTFGTQYSHKLIMDAKFHEDVKIDEQINELYPKLDEANITELDKKCPKNRRGEIVKRNYSEDDKNSVFILHPDTNKSIKQRRNPVKWGNDAYYGEVEMFYFDWDKDNNPNHKYGAILVSPLGSDNSIDNLQRLIGMNLQYSIEDNFNIKLGDINLSKDILDPYPKNKDFCIQCGNHAINLVYKGYSKSKKGKFYQMECNECKHSFVYFYCWNCSHRLIKNGSYWSYHAFHVLEPFDIKCPNCEKYWVNNQDNEQTNHNTKTIQDSHSDNKSKIFINYNEGITYIKNNPGTALIRNPDGDGWVTK